MASNQRREIVHERDHNHTVFERDMRKAVEERLVQLTGQLYTGADIGDYAAYRHITAYVKAFNEVLEIMVHVRDRLNKLERGQTI